jgi:Na+/H+ antiporter NhaC
VTDHAKRILSQSLFVLLVTLVFYGSATAQDSRSPTTQSTSDLAPATTQPTVSAPPEPSAFYGLWTLAPALVAILLAIITRQVIVALACGIFTAAAMLCIRAGDYNPLHFVTYAMNHYLLGVLGPMNADSTGVDLGNLTILIYTLFIGAMIGVLAANGGTRGVVERVTRNVRSRRAGQLSAYFAGLAVFFDDYASAMIVGPGLRPISDRLRISREKLAYLVNWTAAPDSSIFIGTWLAVQIGFLQSGFDALGANRPAYLDGVTAGGAFWATIPYRTYVILVLAMAFLVALTGRDFGPLRRAERAAVNEPQPEPATASAVLPPAKHWLFGALPALVLIGLTIGLMIYTGRAIAHSKGEPLAFNSAGAVTESIKIMLGHGDSHFALLYASLAAAVLAVMMTVLSRTLSLGKTMEAAVSGMTHMFAACIILVLAWGLARASRDLQLGIVAHQFLEKKISQGTFSATLLPLSAFLTACLISFSTGTAWGTMGILCPPIITIAAPLFADLPSDQALAMFYSTVGGTMAGAVFGNTCSPLADVTVLSSISSGCELSAHVRSILPYALVVATVSILSTDGLRYGLARWAPDIAAKWNVYASLAAGALLLLLVLLIIGRRPPRTEIETARVPPS